NIKPSAVGLSLSRIGDFRRSDPIESLFLLLPLAVLSESPSLPSPLSSPIRQLYPCCLRPPSHPSPCLLQSSDESGESEMSSGVLLCVRASNLRDEMESSEKRREEMDLAQRRGRRWTYECLLALMHQYPCLSRLQQAVYYGRRSEILVRRASFPDEFTRLTTIMWINEIVLKHAYYKNQACLL
ncbi:hypothetical protein HID58_067115, partial [Brassica napus]